MVGDDKFEQDDPSSPVELPEIQPDASFAIGFLEQIRRDINHVSHLTNNPSKESGNRSTKSIATEADTVSEQTPVVGEPTEDAREIDRFELRELVGEGGFARVFRAWDPRLEREVAIKIPKPGVLASEHDHRRFSREAQTTALLSHPSIVPVFETGTSGIFTYIVSAFCEGTTLTQWIEANESEITPRTAAGIIAKLAEAIHHAHQRNIIHRDLKPDNVLVEDGSEAVSERLRVTDFGLARQTSSLHTALTMDGAIMGTPAYMSPEQARAESDIGEASDIWSLGVILYELITGELPFCGKNHLATLRAVETAAFVPPAKYNPSIPKDLDAICQKCLSKSPSDRYQTAFELSEELLAFIDGRPVKVRPPTPFMRLKRWVKNNSGLAFALGFAFSSLVIGLGVSLWQWDVASRESTRANREASRAIAEADRASSLMASTFKAFDLMLDDIGKKENVSVSQRELLLEILELQEEIENDPDADKFAISRLEAVHRMMRIHVYIGQQDQCIELAQENLPLLNRIDLSDPDLDSEKAWELIKSMCSTYLHNVLNSRNYKETTEGIAQFETLVDRIEPRIDPLDATCMRLYLIMQRANVFLTNGQLDKSLKLHTEATKLARLNVPLMVNQDSLSKMGIQIISNLINLARIQGMCDLNAEAAQTCDEAIALIREWRTIQPDKYRDSQLNLLNLNSSYYYAAIGNFEAADDRIRRGTQQLQRSFKRKPKSPTTRELLAYAYITQARHALNGDRKNQSPELLNHALEQLDRACQLSDSGLLETEKGCGHFLESLNLKTEALLKQKEPSKARLVAKQAVKFAEKHDFQSHAMESMRFLFIEAQKGLLDSELARRDSEAITESAKQLRQLIESEDQNFADGVSSKGGQEREAILLKALREEVKHLAKQNRFEEAIERINQRFAITYHDGYSKIAGQPRYYSAARQIAYVLDYWSQADGSATEEYQLLKQRGLKWLSLAYENGHFPKTEMLERRIWDIFRAEPGFQCIVKKLKQDTND